MNKNYGEIKLLRTVKQYVEEKYGAIKTFHTLIPDTLALTFDVTDSLYNKLGLITVVDDFSNSDFEQGTHDNTIVKDNRLYLLHGTALQFNGINKVETPWYPSESDFGNNGEGTLEFWAYFTQDNIDQFMGSFGRLENPDDPEADIKEDPLYSRLYMGRHQSGVLRIGYGDDWRNIHDAHIPLNQWVHLAMTNDGNTTYGYVNGNYVGDNPSSFYWDNIVNAFTIGQCNGAYEEAGGPVNRPIHGRIDEVRFWNVCRSEEQINENKTVKIDPSHENLVRYWRLDEGSGEIAECLVDSTYNGTLVDNPLWVAGSLNYGLIEGTRVSGPIYIANHSADLKIIWDAVTPIDTTITIQTASTSNITAPSEESWVTQTSNTTISTLANNYLWIRCVLSNQDETQYPYINWLVVYDNENEPYALPFINCNDETKVLNTDGQTVFNVPSGYLNPHNLRFHGNDNTSYVDLGNSLYLSDNHPFTAEGNITFYEFSAIDTLLSRNDAIRSSSPYTWILGTRDGTRIVAYDGGSWREIEYQFVLNKKYHLAFAYDGTDMYFYVDGELVGIYEGWTFSDSETGRNTQIGGYSSSSNDVNGIKSNIRFWNYARTQEQIQNNINEFIFNPEEGLMGNWHLTEEKDDVVYDYSGNDIHGTLQGITEWTNYDYTLTIIPLNENYVFTHETIDGFLGYGEENEFIELFVEVNSFKFTHQYVEAAVFPTEFPVRFTHQYIEKAAVIYTYLPNLPPFDWYPCFNSTSCWANWTIQEYEGATEGQVLQFTPPSTSNNRQGLFWLTKNAENAILQVKAKVDRVRSAHTEPGIPPPEPIPYSPIIAQRNQPSTLSWFNNILENVVVENNAIQLEPEETEGYTIWYPLDISTGYQDDLEYEGEAPPQIVGSSIIEWSSTEPEGTEIKVYVAIRLEGEDGTQIEEHEWIPAVNGESIPEIEEGDIFDNQFLLIKVEFVTDDPEVTPILHSLSATIYAPEKSGEYEPINGIQYFGVFSRGSGMSNAATTCYVLICTITNDGNRRRQLELGKYTNGSYFRLDAIYYEWEIDEFYFLKIASNADWVQGKIWKASDPEPAGYQLSARDSLTWSSGTETLGSGFSGVYCHNASNTDGLPNYYFDSFYFTPTILKSRISDKLTVKVVSVRDTYESWQSQEHTLERWGYGTYYGERYGN